MAKILFLTSRFPYPLDKGDRLRVFFQLKSLSEKHEIHLVAICDEAVPDAHMEQVRPFCASIHTYTISIVKRAWSVLLSPFKGIPLQVAYFYSAGVHRAIRKLMEGIRPAYIHCHLIRTTEYVKDLKHIHKSLDFMDAFGIGMQKRAANEKNFLKRLVFSYEMRKLFRYEADVFSFIDSFAIISAQDRNEIRSRRKSEIRIVGNGVDFTTFYPRQEEKKYDVLFMGNLAYPPNIFAVEFLVKEVMPLVWKEIPECKLLIAGVGAPPRITSLQGKNTDVISDFADISDSIAMSKVMAAPMKISIGLQNKILQAMAMKVPCVVSTFANNSILAPDGKAILVAEHPQEFAERIVQVLGDQTIYMRLAEEGYKFVHEKFSWGRQNAMLEEVILNGK